MFTEIQSELTYLNKRIVLYKIIRIVVVAYDDIDDSI